MLETRTPPASPRTRRIDAPLRAAAPRASSAASQLRPQTHGSAALGHVQPLPHPVARPAAPVRQSRQSRSEMRLMGAAITSTAVVCGLLLLYLAAYAHVTRLGLEQSQARTQLRENRLKNMMLRAECDRLHSPQFVISRAVAMGMTPRGATPIVYITAASRGDRIRENDESMRAEDGERGTNGGKTADSSASTSFDH